jgi:hypothetical protein
LAIFNRRLWISLAKCFDVGISNRFPDVHKMVFGVNVLSQVMFYFYVVVKVSSTIVAELTTERWLREVLSKNILTNECGSWQALCTLFLKLVNSNE